MPEGKGYTKEYIAKLKKMSPLEAFEEGKKMTAKTRKAMKGKPMVAIGIKVSPKKTKKIQPKGVKPWVMDEKQYGFGEGTRKAIGRKKKKLKKILKRT